MINVTKTYLPEKDILLQYIDEIYKSGWLTNNGLLLQRLEDNLKKFLNVDYLVLTVNGTCALQLAYKLLDLKGEVITTPFSFVATVSSLVWEGLIPVFADIDERTFNIDVTKVEKKITAKTSAILPVHVFGNACDVHAIKEIADNNKIKVIYDSAHAFNVHTGEKNISFFGDISVYSFHSTKVFHTIEGGALVVRSKELYDKAVLMRNFGIPGYNKVTELGVNFKMNEFQAAMGLCVLTDFDKVSLKRKMIFDRYSDAFLANNKIKLQQVSDMVRSNYSYFPVVFREENVLEEISERLNKKQIFPRRYFYPALNTLPYLERVQSMPVAESVSKRILCLPLYADLDKGSQDTIIDIVNKYS